MAAETGAPDASRGRFPRRTRPTSWKPSRAEAPSGADFTPVDGAPLHASPREGLADGKRRLRSHARSAHMRRPEPEDSRSGQRSAVATRSPRGRDGPPPRSSLTRERRPSPACWLTSQSRREGERTATCVALTRSLSARATVAMDTGMCSARHCLPSVRQEDTRTRTLWTA